ncbi:amino acid permease [Lactococcus termiticola]|uniref:Lysine-specific permease n=1 Tax=Lactococcus termiticola TaxID=2169526 RepID=A0A2R5HGQ7_9LACT|nr:amino acid permease [Lactococcus termiticola]GBG96535.1 lysine-specific permease [Lactococcus termiticola]
MEQNANTEVTRGLKTRHVSMIALGGTIGTGLFLTSGEVIHQAGPFGALAAYVLIGAMVYFLMTSLGEMATYLPTSGSFSDYAGRYVDPALGFALGWNYWLNWAITVAVDLTAVALAMQFWFPHVPTWIFSAVALVLVFLINALAVGIFGETEYWLSAIKVTVIIIFLVVGFASIFGIMGGHIDVLKNLSVGNHGFIGGIGSITTGGGILGVLLVAGFSFQGTELLGITAGEAHDPDKSIPKAMNSIFWRILIFYILAIFVMAAIIPFSDPHLAGGDSAVTSPFTLVFERVGLSIAASVMNAVVLTSVLSAANSGMYASTRMLYSLGKHGGAPKFFGKISRTGIPIFALIATTLIALLTFMTSIYGPEIFTILVSASGLTGFIAWIGIAISHFRFRRAYVKQGKDVKALPYHAKLFPFGPILALIMTVLVLIGNGSPQNLFSHSWLQSVIMYAALPLFLVLYLGYKFTHKTKLVPLDKVDLSRE